jgi:hypothetical protein
MKNIYLIYVKAYYIIPVLKPTYGNDLPIIPLNDITKRSFRSEAQIL